MATIANPYNPYDDDQSAAASGEGMPAGGGGGGASSSGGSGSQPAAPASYSPPNVQQYLDANQGAGQQLSGAIQGNVQNQANKFNKSTADDQSKLNTQYDTLNQGLNSGKEVANTAFKDPAKLLSDYNAGKAQASSNQPMAPEQQQATNQYNEFQKLNNGGYNQDIQNYGTLGNQYGNDLQNQLSNLQQQTGSAQNEMGRNQLLQNAVGTPGYNQGQQTLDSLFLQGQGKQLQQGLGNIQQGATTAFQNANTDVASKLKALQGMSGQNQQYIQNLFSQGNENGAGLNQIDANAKNEYAQAQNNAANVQSGLTNAFNTKNFTPEQLNQLGIMPGTHTWGLTGQELMNAGQYQANPLAAADQGGLAQTATPEEFARYNALHQLAGSSQPNIFGTAQQAGGYNPVSFNQQALQQAIAQKQQAITKTDYDKAIQDTLSHFNMSPDTGGGGMKSATGGVSVPIAQQLQSGLASGTMTPEQAMQIIQSGNQNLRNQYGEMNPEVGTWETPFNPFLNYYNQEYAPAQSDVLGQTSPDAIPMPKDSSGNIDWTKIKAPKGK